MSARRCSLDNSEFTRAPRLLCFGYVPLRPVKRHIPWCLRFICVLDCLESLFFFGRVLLMNSTYELDDVVAVIYLLFGVLNLSQVISHIMIIHQKTLTDDRSFLNFQRVKKFYHKSVKFLLTAFWLKAGLLGAKTVFFAVLGAVDEGDLLLPIDIASRVVILAAFAALEGIALYLIWSGLCAIYDRVLRAPCDCHSGVENPELFHRYHTPLFMTDNAIAEDESEEDELRTTKREQSPYQLVRAANLGRPAGVATTGEFRELRDEEIAGVPGANWLYKDYTEHHLLYLRAGHTILYLMELTVFVVGVCLSDGEYLTIDSHTLTPFTPQPVFVFAGWIVLLVLEALFVFVVYQRTLTTVELLAKQLSWYFFPKYFLLAGYFYFQYTDGLTSSIVNISLLVALYPLIHTFYHRVKYQDDGRFLVTRMELLAVHVNISFYAAWIQGRVLHEAFVLVSYYTTGTILGWTNSHWSVLANVLIFCIGVIYLSTYKDVFFNLVIIYSFVGIYIEQVRCPADNGNCSEEIKKTVIVLGVILSLFVLLVLILYHNQILYRRRN